MKNKNLSLFALLTFFYSVHSLAQMPVQFGPGEIKRELKSSENVYNSLPFYQIQSLKTKQENSRFFFSFFANRPGHFDVKNLKSLFGLGLGVGVEFSSAFILESLFSYSKQSVEVQERESLQFIDTSRYSAINRKNLFNINQYGLSLDLKYGFKNQIPITPYFGGMINYSYRQYSGQSKRNNFGLYSIQKAESHAINLGPVLGLNFEITKNFSFGLDSRVSFNVYNTNPKTERISSQGNKTAPVEDFTQWFLGLKMNLII